MCMCVALELMKCFACMHKAHVSYTITHAIHMTVIICLPILCMHALSIPIEHYPLNIPCRAYDACNYISRLLWLA